MSFSERIRTKEPLVGSFHDLIDPALIELVGYAGFDFVVFEHEHGLRNYESLQHLIRAAQHAGMYTMVRIAGSDLSFIERVLDAGADGVLVPHVKTAEQARAIVQAAKYPPAGTRGEGYARRGHIWDLGPQNREWQLKANEETVVMALIEDPEGVENIEEIVKVPGLDAIQPGPGDLAVQMGKDSLFDPEVVEAVGRVRDAANRAGMPHATFLIDPDGVPDAHDAGSTVFLFGHDVIYLARMYRELNQKARKHLG